MFHIDCNKPNNLIKRNSRGKTINVRGQLFIMISYHPPDGLLRSLLSPDEAVKRVTNSNVQHVNRIVSIINDNQVWSFNSWFQNSMSKIVLSSLCCLENTNNRDHRFFWQHLFLCFRLRWYSNCTCYSQLISFVTLSNQSLINPGMCACVVRNGIGSKLSSDLVCRVVELRSSEIRTKQVLRIRSSWMPAT